VGTADVGAAAVPAAEGPGGAEPLGDSPPVPDGLGELVVEVGLPDAGVDEIEDEVDDGELVGSGDVGAAVGLGLADPVGSGVCPPVCVPGALGESDVAGVVFARSGLPSGSGRKGAVGPPSSPTTSIVRNPAASAASPMPIRCASFRRRPLWSAKTGLSSSGGVAGTPAPGGTGGNTSVSPLTASSLRVSSLTGGSSSVPWSGIGGSRRSGNGDGGWEGGHKAGCIPAPSGIKHPHRFG
jgi:hypothetical protein